MAMRGTALAPSMISRSIVCANEIANGDISGILYNPYMEKPVKFNSFYWMARNLDAFFDNVRFPHSHCQYRSFKTRPARVENNREEVEVRRYMSDEIFATESGQKATFVVHVQFRQNATWQGSVTWTEGKKTQRFRSVMELLRLMESAIDPEEMPAPSFGAAEQDG